ncbi:hypothetical protein Sango_2091300 [Sesamum angolense]|uniref:SWIM-type domain-containing protein n=1 Tax=Sesamum angolense TaxID=2727404 RepID=A0AAE1WBE4_9LAMI|nr:hypothetical protein Sango_2091300 [Sesamum angolense]
MSTSSSRVDIFVYFGGNYTSDGWCFTYDRQPVAAMRIPRSSTYAQFLKRIYQKIGTSNPDFGAGNSNPDFGAGTYNSEPGYYTPNMVTVTQGLDNIDFHYTEPTHSHTPLSENFIPHENDAEDPTGDSFVNESDEASEPDEAEYPIPPEDGLDHVDINVMAATFAQRGEETSSEPALPDRITQPTFYRSIPFFEQTFPEIPADSVDVPNLRYAKFYNKSEGRLDKGMLFKTKEELMEAVQDHSIRHARREYYVTESSKTKQGTIVEWKHKGFQQSTGKYVMGYVFWAFKPCIDGFKFCRKIISVDGTHLYTKYKHKLLIAAAMDGNQQDLCWQVGLEYQLRKFNRIMEEIKKQSVKAFAYLDQINKQKWTASHDGGWRCGILTTNMLECINGVLKGARRLPVSALVEITLERTVHCFRVRAIKGHKMLQNNQLWTDFACKMFISWQQKVVEHTVTKYSHAQQSASVVTRRQNRHGMNTHVVKIASRECSCGKWNQFGIPCSHAQKVCGAYNISAVSMVKDYYDLMACNNTYSKHFEPVQSEDYWDDPNF